MMDYFSNEHVAFSSQSTMDDEENLENFYENYVPLSNLPTPPLSAAATPAEDEFTDTDPAVLAPAIHLCNLIPSSAARTRLSPGKLAEYLTRAQLSFAAVALAACILDALSSNFVRKWRAAIIEVQCADQFPARANPSKKRTSLHRSRSSWGSGVYNWKPELIALAALQVSSSWVDDIRSSPKWWADSISRSDVSATDLDATIRCILQEIDYQVGAFSAEDVECMKRAMQRGIHHIDSAREQKSPVSEESWM